MVDKTYTQHELLANDVSEFGKDPEINFDTFRYRRVRSKGNIDVLQMSSRQSVDDEQVDFNVQEISDLLDALSNRQTARALRVISNNEVLKTIPWYRAFGIYMSIIFNCEPVFDSLLSDFSVSFQEGSKLDQKCSLLICNNSFSQFQRNECDCLDSLTEVVMYRALDFNIKDVFELAVRRSKQLRFRKSDTHTLLRYKHYDVIEESFGKNIKRGLLQLFFDIESIAEEDEYHQKYGVAYYIDLMLTLDFEEQQVISFINHFFNYFELETVLLVFVRHQRLDLVKWVQLFPQYSFKVGYFGNAIHYEAFEIAYHFYQSHQYQISQNQRHVPAYLIQSLKQRSSLFVQKIVTIEQYFAVFSAEQSEEVMNIFLKVLFSSSALENPFMFVKNPFELASLTIALVRKFADKYRSLQVKQLQIEAQIEEATLKFLDLSSNDNINKALLNERMYNGVSPLYQFSKLRMFKIIQHRNVQEVISNLYRSEYSIESSVFDIFSAFTLAVRSNIASPYDIEIPQRFYKQSWDRSQASQSSFMVHIWKKSIFIRLLTDVILMATIIVVVQFTVIIFLSNSLFQANYFTAIDLLGETLVDDPFDIVKVQLAVQYCNEIKISLSGMFIQVRIIDVSYMCTVLLFLRLLLNSIFISLTKRIRPFWTMRTFIELFLGCSGIYYIQYYINRFKYEPNIEICVNYASYTSKEAFMYEYVYGVFQPAGNDLYYTFANFSMQLWIFLQLGIFKNLGIHLKTYALMFKELFKIMIFYIVLMSIFMFFFFFLFLQLDQFSSYIKCVQYLFNMSLGNFNYRAFATEEDDLETSETVGKFVLTVWLMLSNVMLLNLLIALFSDTYNKLQQVAEGIHLIDIVLQSPDLSYDQYYSSLISTPIPFQIVLIPFYILQIIFKSKRLNELVLLISHFLTLLFIIIPLLIVFAPIMIAIAYIKCLLNKLNLILKKQICDDRTNKIVDIIFFLIFGLPLLFVNCLFDTVKMFYFLLKPESELRLRNYQEDDHLYVEDFYMVINKFYRRDVKQETPPQSSKKLINMLQRGLNVHQKCSDLLFCPQLEAESWLYMKRFIALKDAIILNSINCNGEYIHYPQILKGVMREIILNLSMKTMTIQQQSCQKNKVVNTLHSQQLSNIGKYQQDIFKKLNFTIQDILDEFSLCQLGNIWKAYVKSNLGNKDEFSQEQELFINQTIKQLEEEAAQLKKSIIENVRTNFVPKQR